MVENCAAIPIQASPLGSDSFVSKMELGYRLCPLPIGRPLGSKSQNKERKKR